MKGKKFDAAEKHFREKEIKIRQATTYYKTQMEGLKMANALLVEENEQLAKENANIKAKYQKLLAYTELSEEDIKTALKKDKATEFLSSTLNIIKQIQRY